MNLLNIYKKKILNWMKKIKMLILTDLGIDKIEKLAIKKEF